jgi:membrane protease subunit (stomatin/prohibitin family)
MADRSKSGLEYGFESPFKADVYYVTTRLFTGNKWGTSNPIMVRDPDFGIVRVRSFGTYDFRIVEPKTFLKEVAGSDHNLRLDEFADTMRSRLVSVFSDALASAKIPVLDLATRYQEIGEALLPLINPLVVAKYGLEITSFIVEKASVPREVEQAIDKRSSMSAVGNLNDYVKYRMAQGMEREAAWEAPPPSLPSASPSRSRSSSSKEASLRVAGQYPWSGSTRRPAGHGAGDAATGFSPARKRSMRADTSFR